MTTPAVYVLISALLVVTARTNFSEHDSPPKIRSLRAPARGGCSDNNARIINAKPAHNGQFPYMVFIACDQTMICAGALIGERHVLTAGQCIIDTLEFHVRIGSVHRSQNDTALWTQSTPHALFHPEFGEWGAIDVKNDLGIIYLHNGPPNGKFISRAALPSFSEVHDSFVGRLAYLAGWGRTSHNDTRPAETLQWTEVKVISNEACLMFHDAEFIEDSKLCAADIIAAGCWGDIGSPLVLRTRTGFKVIGVASLVTTRETVPDPQLPSRCTICNPTIYARVTSHLKWIRDNV